MNKKNNLVSVVVVNYNGEIYLKRCVESILKNNYSDYEIIVVDNASADGSIVMFKENFGGFDKLRIISLDKNYGPAKARNEGVKLAKGEIIGFLDNDTEVDPYWISNALKYFENDSKIGALQCKLLLLNDKNKIDYAGEYLGSLGFLVHVARYGEEDKGQYDEVKELLAAKSAGMFIRKDVFEKIGGFDDDYFIFVEETDLGWRAWLAGYKTIFAYDSRVYHYYSATKVLTDKNFNNYLVRFHGPKNYILTLYKNLSFKNLIFILPRHIFLWFCLAMYLILTGNRNSGFNILKGIGWNIANYQKNRKKRILIQRARIISDEELFAKIYKKQNLFYHIKNFLKSQKQVITPENQ
ncbi:MAG TPA: glycosyltransferase family 2 protein [Candidatus Paceibacterota bacterium]